MRKTLPILAAAVFSVACTGTTTPESSSSAPASSSAVAVSSSSEAPSSSSVISSSSETTVSSSSETVVPSSASVVSSSSVAPSSSSEATADCSSVDVEAGKAAFIDMAEGCTGCHGDYDANQMIFPKALSIAPNIDPNNIVHGGNLGLADYIIENMAAGLYQSCYDQADQATCIERGEEIAKYINSFSSNTEWCEGLVETSSSSAMVSSSAPSSSSSSAAADAKVVYAINVGSTTAATYDGVSYEPAGAGLQPALNGATNGTATIMGDIAGTDEDAMFQTQRYGLFTYDLPVTASEYNVTLFFAEDFADAPAVRIMSATAEGKVVLANADLFDAHGRLTVISYTINDVEVSDGALTLDFTASANLATLSGILVTSVDGDQGEIVIPPSPCEGTGNYVCVDFESALPNTYTLGSNAEVQSGTAKTGNSALYFYTNNFGENFGGAPYYGGYMTAPNIPGKHWGRLYYLIDDIVNPAGYTHTTFVAAKAPQSEVRLVDTVRDPNGAFQYLYNFPDDAGGAASSYNWRFGSEWVCVEWSVNSDTQDYAFYHNGTIVNEISRNFAGDHGGIPVTYEWMKFGGQVYQGGQNGPEITGWIDDIVVGPERIGCD